MPNNKTIVPGYYTFKIEWKCDYDWADLSYLGKPTDKRGEYMVDRKKGRLFGELVTEDWTLKYEAIKGAEMKDNPWTRLGMSPTEGTYDKARAAFEEHLREIHVDFGDDPDYWPDVRWDEDSKEFYAEIYGCKILADNLGCTMGRGEYRYFEPEYIHSAPDGSAGQNEIRCAVEDW